MAYDKKIDSLMQRLKDVDALSSIKTIKAYPYAIKSTRLANPVLCFSLAEIEAESVTLDNDYLWGRYGIDATLYSPFTLGSPYASDVMQSIVSALLDTDVVGIKVSAFTSDENVGCYVCKCTLMYNYDYIFEEVANG